MKRVLFISTAVVLAVLSFSCVTTSIPFEPKLEGHHLDKPVNVKMLKKAVLLSLPRYNWQVIGESDGSYSARFTKSEGLIVADIRVDYGEEGYTISYVDSEMLDMDPDSMTIHKNYVRWVNNLNKAIFMKYSELTIE